MSDPIEEVIARALAELRQERERADLQAKARMGLRAMEVDYVRGVEAALSRAEETIKKAIECENHTHWMMTERRPTREDSSLTWRILTDYDKQKEADHG